MASRFLFLVLAVPSLVWAEPALVWAEPVKVGAILSLTGDIAHFGMAIQQGMELAVREDNDLEVIYEDDQTLDRVAAVNAAKKLTSQDEVPLVLNMVVNTVTAIAPVFSATDTIALVVWDSNKTISSLGENIYGLGYSTELAGEDLAEFAKSKLEVKSVGVISAHDEWSELISEAFVNRASSLGVKIPFHEKVNVESTDFRTLILRAKSQKVDALFGPLFGGGLMAWIRQSKELRYKGALLTGDSISGDEVNQLGAKTAEGVYASQVWVDDPKFVEKVGSQVDGVKLGFIAMGYDAVSCTRQLLRAIRAEGKEFESKAIREKLKNFLCQGVTGPIEISRESNRKEKILQVRNGAFQLVE